MNSRACPCGSGDAYDVCCGPLHAGPERGGIVAPSPERLMRSRYSAFVVRDERYLIDTWHPGTVPDDFDLRERITWTGLDIIDAPPVDGGGAAGAGGGGRSGLVFGTVEFVAHYRDASGDGEQHERSRFVLQAGRWWYLDGVVR